MYLPSPIWGGWEGESLHAKSRVDLPSPYREGAGGWMRMLVTRLCEPKRGPI